VRDGADFRHVDRVMEKFGWPMGPAYLLDVVGIDTAHHAAQVMAAGFPDRLAFAEKPIHTLMYEQKRLGQKSGVGFYRYEPDRKGKLKKIEDAEAFSLVRGAQNSSAISTVRKSLGARMGRSVLEVIRGSEGGIMVRRPGANMPLWLALASRR